MARTVHIIGAGLAGLAAAIRLTRCQFDVVVHEATAYPGGRCRSYFDRTIGMVIDNGNHLVLSGNRDVLEFAQTIGSVSGLIGPPSAEYLFVNLASGQRWTLQIGNGLPWWILDATRRVPDTALSEYLMLARLLFVRTDGPLQNVLRCNGPLYDRLVYPLLLAALNVEPREGSALLASAVVRETLARGGQACRPLIAKQGLGSVFIEPALAYLRKRGVQVRLEHELRAFRFSTTRVSELDFGADRIPIGDDDAVILAVPGYAAAALLDGLQTPQIYRGIMNAHFRIDTPSRLPSMIGVLNGMVEWVFVFPGRVSTTISNADRYMDMPRAELARNLWQDVCAATGLTADLPPWQIVRERRATFAATPAENARRPAAKTQWANLFLAGDWTATGLPATLEGAVRSGNRAADLVIAALTGTA